HLTAAKGAIASGEGTDVDTAQEARVEIGVLRGGRRIAPGIAALMGGEARTIRCRLGTGGEFPLGFGRQPAAGPVTVRLGLIPRHIRHRGMWLERHRGIEVLPKPLLPVTLPVERVLCVGLGAPDPALGTPAITPLVAPSV